MMTCLIYLHGFASSPNSTKATTLRDRFQSLGYPLIIPDLNQGDFTHLTLTRQMAQVAALFPAEHHPVGLIGSSLGGLTAAWLGEHYAQVQRLVLLAPAFQFLEHWLPRLGPAQVQEWERSQYLQTYHYGEQRMRPLHYHFLTDASRYREDQLQRPIPTLILHGIHDEVIPIASSRTYATTRPWVTLIELQSDHALTTVQEDMWSAIQAFGLAEGSA